MSAVEEAGQRARRRISALVPDGRQRAEVEDDAMVLVFAGLGVDAPEIVRWVRSVTDGALSDPSWPAEVKGRIAAMLLEMVVVGLELAGGEGA